VLKDRTGRGLGELALIVAGVFIALAAERWVSGRSDRDLAVQYAQDLISDLTLDSATHSTWDALAADRVRAVEALIDDLNGEGEPLSGPESLGHLYYAAIVPLPQYQEGTYRDLVSTGGSRLLEPEARRALFEYHTRREEARRIYSLWGYERPDFGDLIPGSMQRAALEVCFGPDGRARTDRHCGHSVADSLFEELPALEQEAIFGWRTRADIRAELQGALAATILFQRSQEQAKPLLVAGLAAARKNRW
jgi:hypothetical protein